MKANMILTIYGDYAKPQGQNQPNNEQATGLTPSIARSLLESIYFIPGKGPNYRIDDIKPLKTTEMVRFRRKEIQRPIVVKKLLQQIEVGEELGDIITFSEKPKVIQALRRIAYTLQVHIDGDFDRVQRRLRLGQFSKVPCLGTEEFQASIQFIDGRKVEITRKKSDRKHTKLTKSTLRTVTASMIYKKSHS